MRLKITKRIRTSDSEQWTLFDADRINTNGEFENVGKLDVHYTEDMAFVTLLLWSEFVGNLGEASTQTLVDDLMDEVTAPIGVPATYSLDFFTPSLSDYKFLTNDDADDDTDEEEEDFAYESEDAGKRGANGRKLF